MAYMLVGSAIAAVLLAHACVCARAACARTSAGWACGARRVSDDGVPFVSFLGMPYARQPLGALRFQELQPPEPWEGVLDATQEGPACPQRDVFYGRIMQPRGTSEACIHVNVHVPLAALPPALPPATPARAARHLRPPHQAALPHDKQEGEEEAPPPAGLPIVVFMHGGGFTFGSGDTDLHGPEYLVGKGVIVVTFNYRLNVFGFLSLNSSRVPGNNGLRDAVTLLRWVRDNARAFGGDARDVTLAGHSAGATAAHLLSLSAAAEGLFNRVLLMSGTAYPMFYTSSPAYAKFVSNMFLAGVGINSTDPEEVHRELVEIPLDKIMEVHNTMQDQFGILVFCPVEETPFPNVTTILDDDPTTLLVEGRGKDIPLMVGFTDAECYGFLPRFEQIDMVTRVKENPLIMTPLQLLYSSSPKVSLDVSRRIQGRYFHGEITMDNYLKSCSDAYFIYPAMKLAQIRAAVGGAPVYLYEFSYQSEFSVKKEVDNVTYKGAGHMEDLTYVFRVNSVLGPQDTFKPTRNDEDIKNWMVHFVTNFIRCSDPACNRERRPSFATPWPPFSTMDMRYQGINMPFYRTLELNNKQLEMVRFFDSLMNRTS